MNDLFSNSFKRYTDLKEQAFMDDMESGKEAVNLDKFFEDVENVKQDMATVEKLYKQLQDANEETKIVHNAKTMKDLRARMDSDVTQVLKQVKIIKGKLEALERSNAASRNIAGCGPGSSADRTRSSVVCGLGKKLKDLMDDFQGLRAKMATEYKETVERRYYTITGQKADEDTIENLISSGESESFQVFLDMAALVEAQGQQLNDIESHVAHASSFVRRGTDSLQVAREYQKSSRKWTCLAIILGAIVVVLLLLPILPTLISMLPLKIRLPFYPYEPSQLVTCPCS